LDTNLDFFFALHILGYLILIGTWGLYLYIFSCNLCTVKTMWVTSLKLIIINLLSYVVSIFYFPLNVSIFWSKRECTPHLSMKQGSLFCHFVISQTMALHVMLLVFLGSSWWIGVHQLGLRLFGAMVWKLLIIEPCSQWNEKLYWNLRVF
jgi:hypothetical protein